MSSALGILMFIPMIVDIFDEGRAWRAFGISGGITTLFGALLATITYTDCLCVANPIGFKRSTLSI